MKLPRVSSGPALPELSARTAQLRRRIAFLRSRAALGGSVAVLGLLILGGWAFLRGNQPALAVPVPPRPDQLEPQLRQYIASTAIWVQQKPHLAERHQTLGLVYFANALWEEASQAFSNVARLNPKQPLAPLYIAAATQELGDINRAAHLVREVTVRFPNFAPGFSRLGEIALRTGAVDEAEQAFQQLIALAPNEPRGFAGLGEVQLRKGQPADAAKNLEKAIALEPEAKGAHNLLGLAYRALNRMDEAKLELTLGLNHVSYPMPDAWSVQLPQHMRLLQDQLDVANALGQSGQADQAAALLERALRYHPQHLGLLNNLAIAYNRAGRPEKAWPILQKALALDERYLPAHITLAFTLQGVNRPDQALAAAERALALSPQTTQAHLAKANALLGLERDKEALAALEMAAQTDPKNGEIQLEIGDIYWRNLQEPETAFDRYRTATNLTPTLAGAHVRIADYHLRRSDTNAAAPVLRVLRRIAPKSPELVVLEGRWQNQTFAH